MTAYHYSLQYPVLAEIRRGMSDTRRSPRLDQAGPSFNGVSDPTEEAAARCAAISRKMQLIEDTAAEAGGESFKSWIMRGVCYGDTYIQLQNRGIPCGKDLYYEMRRRYYYLLANKI